jgi:hypothetical protein
MFFSKRVKTKDLLDEPWYRKERKSVFSFSTRRIEKIFKQESLNFMQSVA